MDVELLDQHRKGDSAAFAELVRRHLPWVYGMARRRVRDEHLAEDVAQAVFVLLHRKGPEFEQDRAMIAWLHKTAWYATETALRNRRRREIREKEAGMARAVSTDGLAGSGEWEELAPVLDEMVGKLGRRDREAVLLRFYRDLTFGEVGREMGISEEAARKRVERAIGKLQGFAGAKGLKSLNPSTGSGRGSEKGVEVLMAGLLGVRVVAPKGLAAVATGAATASSGALLGSSAGSIVKGASFMMMSKQLSIAAAILLVIGGFIWGIVPGGSARHAGVAVADDTGAAATAAPVAMDQFPKVSPFSHVRWKGATYEVQVEGTWYELVGVNDVKFADMLSFSQTKYGDIWQKRIDEDLVEVLTTMGHTPADTVSLELKTLDKGEAVTLDHVAMTADNRLAIWAERNPLLRLPAANPFAAMRWNGDQPQVQVKGTWYDLFNVEDKPVDDIVAFAKQNYGDDWKKTFETKLAEILTGMGVKVGDTLKVKLFVTDVSPDVVAQTQPGGQ